MYVAVNVCTYIFCLRPWRQLLAAMNGKFRGKARIETANGGLKLALLKFLLQLAKELLAKLVHVLAPGKDRGS